MSAPLIRTRFSESRGTSLGIGMPADELWGVAQRNHGERHRHRGEDACARRRAKRAAKARGVPLKAYLRSVKS